MARSRRSALVLGEGFRFDQYRRRFSRVAIKLAEYRSRGLREGLVGGSRKWMVVGGVAWTLRLLSFLFNPKPQVVYRTKLDYGESIVLTQHKRRPKST
jgi:hypothetical protein